MPCVCSPSLLFCLHTRMATQSYERRTFPIHEVESITYLFRTVERMNIYANAKETVYSILVNILLYIYSTPSRTNLVILLPVLILYSNTPLPPFNSNPRPNRTPNTRNCPSQCIRNLNWQNPRQDNKHNTQN